MIIETKDQVTEAVLEEMKRTPDARTREILAAFIRHLHGFIREVRLTEREFHEAIRYVNAVGQATTPSHNEAMLLAGALGRVEPRVPDEQRRAGHARDPRQHARALLARGRPVHRERRLDRALAHAGRAAALQGWVRDQQGRPVAGAEIDVWHSSPAGLYENQDATQADMNLRGVSRPTPRARSASRA